MTKSELIERIAQAQSHLVERDVALAVNMMLDLTYPYVRFATEPFSKPCQDHPHRSDLIRKCARRLLWIRQVRF